LKPPFHPIFQEQAMLTLRESDPERDQRISDIFVDCYSEDEEAMAWYYYLDEQLGFPFKARCVVRRSVSPLKVGDEVKVLGMAPEKECGREMFVLIRRGSGKLAVPLVQLEPVEADAKTVEAVGDWRYWFR
jgi:hypothetical protein